MARGKRTGGGGHDESDRRRHPRVEVETAVMIEATGSWVGPYACENLSASGGLFVGAGRLGVGDRLFLKLMLPGRAPVEVEAHVRRAATRSSTEVAYGVAFADLPPDSEDEIQGAVLAALERGIGPGRRAVLVVHELELTRRALERDVRALGYDPVTAATVDEALTWLAEPDHACSVVIVDGQVDPAMRLTLLDRLVEQRPGARRVLLSGLARSARAPLPLSSAHAHAVVTQPWTLQSFGDALRGADAPAVTPGP